MSIFRHRITGLCALTSLLLALAPFNMRGQTIDTGAVQGRVLDGRGAPLPGVVVRAKGPQGAKATETDSAGHYSLPFLVPGSY